MSRQWDSPEQHNVMSTLSIVVAFFLVGPLISFCTFSLLTRTMPQSLGAVIVFSYLFGTVPALSAGIFSAVLFRMKGKLTILAAFIGSLVGVIALFTFMHSLGGRHFWDDVIFILSATVATISGGLASWLTIRHLRIQPVIQ